LNEDYSFASTDYFNYSINVVTMIKTLSFDTQLFDHSLISILLMLDVALNSMIAILQSIDIVLAIWENKQFYANQFTKTFFMLHLTTAGLSLKRENADCLLIISIAQTKRHWLVFEDNQGYFICSADYLIAQPVIH
jgi:hypothetical protein